MANHLVYDGTVTCLVEGCEGAPKARGLCSKHYQRSKKAGNLPPKARPARTPCNVEGCDKVVQAEGVCRHHLYSLRVHGDPLAATEYVSRAPEQRFWEKVDKDGPLPLLTTLAVGKGPCWIWTAGTDGEGYGNLKWEGRTRDAHLVAYELLVGPVPEGYQVDHLCMVRLCVNPRHLEAVTQQENIRRAWAMRGFGELPEWDPEIFDAEVMVERAGQSMFTAPEISELCGYGPTWAQQRVNRGQIPPPAVPAVPGNPPEPARWSKAQVVEIMAEHLRRKR